MCLFFFILLGVPLFLWLGAVSGWNDTFILCTCCMVMGVYLRLREHVILCLPFLFIGILGMVAFFLGWV
ncbi:MAG: hypothetical protein Q4D48_07305 [Coriobacteriales bacterium]|jgi:hypothetical protein|nr:hypothetical protein [Coriobacteriales bacterium]